MLGVRVSSLGEDPNHHRCDLKGHARMVSPNGQSLGPRAL
jgi:hypothetical protein